MNWQHAAIRKTVIFLSFWINYSKADRIYLLKGKNYPICLYFCFPQLGEYRLDPEKSSLKMVLLLPSPFLLTSFFRREEKKGKKYPVVVHLVI